MSRPGRRARGRRADRGGSGPSPSITPPATPRRDNGSRAGAGWSPPASLGRFQRDEPVATSHSTTSSGRSPPSSQRLGDHAEWPGGGQNLPRGPGHEDRVLIPSPRSRASRAAATTGPNAPVQVREPGAVPPWGDPPVPLSDDRADHRERGYGHQPRITSATSPTSTSRPPKKAGPAPVPIASRHGPRHLQLPVRSCAARPLPQSGHRKPDRTAPRTPHAPSLW